ncbi:hypothetical protein [Chamaesiphon sp.]|uniref:hypothetical protein n=1 Tax=Chamaesiphon sp. TaxID=2814140 RepID=UPI003594716B
MKSDRRKLFGLITGLVLALTSSKGISLAQKKYLTIDRKRSLPFLLGWYDRIENTDLSKKVYAKGINILMPYVGEKLRKELIKSFLDTCETVGVKVLLEIYRPFVDIGNIAAIKDFVRTYKNHPAVYAWYLYDEPEIRKPIPLDPQLLEQLYQVIKDEDKSKPVALVFADPDKIEPFVNSMDILMWDWYPCLVGEPEFQWVPAYRRRFYQVISIANLHQKKFYNVLQASNEKQSTKRLPSIGEFRYMFYLSIVTGADGLLFWMHYFSVNLWNESVLYPTVIEFKKYIPAVIKGKDLSSTVKVSSTDVQLKLFSIPNTKKYLAIAINHERVKINLTINFNRTFAGKTVATSRTKIAQLSTNADFTTLLKPYEVVVWTIG